MSATTDIEFMEEAQWQQRIHDALAKYTTADVVTEIRKTLGQWTADTVDEQKVAVLESITDEVSSLSSRSLTTTSMRLIRKP